MSEDFKSLGWSLVIFSIYREWISVGGWDVKSSLKPSSKGVWTVSCQAARENHAASEKPVENPFEKPVEKPSSDEVDQSTLK